MQREIVTEILKLRAAQGVEQVFFRAPGLPNMQVMPSAMS